MSAQRRVAPRAPGLKTLPGGRSRQAARPDVSVEQQLALNLARADPDTWIRRHLGATLSPNGIQIAEAVRDHPRVAVKAAHSISKSWSSARIVIWFLHAYPGSVVLTTAPTYNQVANILWREIGAAYEVAPLPLLGRYLAGTKIDIADKWYALGFKSADKQGHRFQGFHCLAEDHEILTRRGWLDIDAMTEDDEVLSVPPQGETAGWMPVTAVHRYPFEGDLNVYESRNVSFAVTDEHRFPAKGQKDRDWRLRRLSELPGGWTLRRRSGWGGADFTVPAPFAKFGWGPEKFAEFLGFWIGDGGLRQHSTGRFYEVLCYQKKDDAGYLDRLLAGLRLGKGRDHLVFSNRACAEWLLEHVGRYGQERQIPRFVLDAPPAVLDAFLEGFWRAEGSWEDGERRTVYNSNARLMDQVQEILVKLGRPATMSVNTVAGAAKHAEGIDFPARHDCLCLSWVRFPADHFVKKARIRREPYQGRVWCVSTPHETFYTRRKGRVCLSGNSPYLLVVVDEANGVARTVIESLVSTLSSGHTRLLLIGNPVEPEGEFYEAFTTKAELYRTLTVSAFDTPNFALHGIRTLDDVLSMSPADLARAETYPYLTTPRWVREVVLEHGADSQYVASRVLATFPSSTPDALISLGLVEAAARRGEIAAVRDGQVLGVPLRPSDDHPVEAGFDVADAGLGADETVLTTRQGPLVLAEHAWTGKDPMESVAYAAHLLAPYGPRLKAVRVDVIGIGSGPFARMRELGLPVVAVDVRESTLAEKGDFPNRRAELWWGLRERFARGDIAFGRATNPDGTAGDSVVSQRTIGQLTSIKARWRTGYRFPDVERKDDLKRRGLKSPDRAEALIFSFAAGLGYGDNSGMQIVSSTRIGGAIGGEEAPVW